MNLWSWISTWIRLTSKSQEKEIKRLRRLRSEISQRLDYLVDGWTLYETIPGSVPGVSLWRFPPLDGTISVVLQGPVIEDRQFTLNTIKLYRSIVPDCNLIVSTWENTNPSTVKSLEACGCAVVINPIPSPGPRNINCQIASTLAGFHEACKSKPKYLLKSRTDVRLVCPNFDRRLLALSKCFPLSGDITGQESRILVSDNATRLYVPNHLSDIMMFGNAQDLVDYWNISPVDGECPAIPIRSLQDLYKSFTPEIHLCESFLRRIGETNDRTLEGWWRQLATRFLVVDRTMLRQLWYKYRYNESHRTSLDDQSKGLALCEFADWLLLFKSEPQPRQDFPLAGRLSWTETLPHID